MRTEASATFTRTQTAQLFASIQVSSACTSARSCSIRVCVLDSTSVCVASLPFSPLAVSRRFSSLRTETRMLPASSRSAACFACASWSVRFSSPFCA